MQTFLYAVQQKLYEALERIVNVSGYSESVYTMFGGTSWDVGYMVYGFTPGGPGWTCIWRGDP